MTQNALFGQYWAANSPVHAMDSRIKLTALLVVMIAIFAAASFTALGVCALYIILFYVIARIPFQQAFKAIAPLAFIVVITALLNMFFVQGGPVYFQTGPLEISQLGLHNAAFLGLRLTELLFAASLLTLTTATLDLADAFEAMLAPLRRVGFPAHECAMIMGIALRFLPQFIEEWRTIRAAQISRGAHVGKQSPAAGLRMLTSLMVPLFTSAFRHADTLSAAMDARCYHGAEGRTKLKPMQYTQRDTLGTILVFVLLISVIATNTLLAH